jgi:uncharacterized DUF497 family protein
MFDEGFEWDPNKELKNRRKHRVSFREAITVFFDERAIDLEDQLIDGEVRYVTIGMGGKGRVLVVCWCERGFIGGVIRIISARKATEREVGVYQKG